MLSTTTKVLTVLTLLAASVSSASIGHASNNLAHKRHGNEVTHNAVLQARAARRRDMSDFAKIAAEEDVAKRRMKKRGANARRCAMKSSSSAFPSSTAAPTESSSTVEATSTSVETTEATTTAKKIHSYAEPTTTTSPPKTSATKTKTSSAAAATTSSTSDDGGSSSGESFTGEATFYGTGLGACGITNKDTDYICAVSHLLFDGFEGYTGGNPNSNPICNKKIKATYKGKSVTVTVTDRCVGCAKNDLDFAPSAFDQLADEALGRLTGMTWEWI